ncbi:MAG: ABC transporter ATP-binding protein [Oceanococcus sp.]|nr:MAG: ABC transporter ATP-binding protein [Oceanococcus sp.]
MHLAIHNLSAQHEQHLVIDGLELDLEKGQFACLLGPSGSGKSTLLRCIAGFHALKAGEIHVGGECLSKAGYTRSPEERGIGMVFQDLALLPHLTVAENIAFGLFRWTKQQRQMRVHEMLELIALSALVNQYPHQLSGGQQQRVAVARALAPNPRLLLLDEPFSSLDNELRLELANQLRDIVKETGTTALMVTHDQQEAFAMGDVLGVLNAGRLEQWSSAYQLYHEPASRFVAQFVGEGVFIPAQVENGELISELGSLGHIRDALGDISNKHVDVLLRPDDILHDDDSQLQAIIRKKAFRGADILYRLELASGQKLLSLVPSHHNHALNSPLGIRLDVDHLVVFNSRRS